MPLPPWPARAPLAPATRECPAPRRAKCRRWSCPSGMCGARSIATGNARRALSLGFSPVHTAEVIGHLLDLVLRPQRAAADHAVERALPGAAVLALIHPHVGAVALEALVDQHVLARRVGKADRCRLRALRERRLREKHGGEDRERQFHRRLYVAQNPAATDQAFLPPPPPPLRAAAPPPPHPAPTGREGGLVTDAG